MCQNKRLKVMGLIAVGLLLVAVVCLVVFYVSSQKLFDCIDEADYEKLERQCEKPLVNVNIYSKNLGWIDHIAERPLPKTPLEYACSKNDTRAVSILLKNGADPNKTHRSSNSSPLSIAAARGNLEIVTLLAEHGADVEEQAYYALCSAIRYARYQGDFSLQDFQTMVELFERNGFELNQTNIVGENILFEAARFSDLEVTKYLIEDRGMSVSVVNSDGQTLLHMVCKAAFAKEEKAAYVTYLIERGINLHVKDSSGKTACDYAAESAFLDVVKLLEERQ